MYEYEVLLKDGEHTFIWGRDYDDGRARTPRPVFRVNRQFAQFSIRIFGEFDERNFPKIP